MNYDKLRRLLGKTAILAAGVAFLSSCTASDDTLGADFLPEDQQMTAGTLRLAKAARYFETRLYQTDSIKASNLGTGYFGTARNDTTGSVTAGFLTQYVNYYRIDSGYFGYRPIFDSALLQLSVSSYGRDTLTPQQFAVYEITNNDYLTEGDSLFYLNFDPTPYVSAEPLFTFTFPVEGSDGPRAMSSVRMMPTERGREFVKRLMISDGTHLVQPDVPYSIYENDAEFVRVFKGLYIKPTNPAAIENGKGSVYGTTLSASGFSIYGRNRVESDPTLIKDTVGAIYYFYHSEFTAGNQSVNVVRHDYTGSQVNPADAAENNPDRPLTTSIVVSGMGGVISELTFTEEFFKAVEAVIEQVNAERNENYTTLAMNRALLTIYFTGSDYDWEKVDPGTVTPLMSAALSRLGAYTDYKTLKGVPDYDYYSEKNYNYTLSYGGYINRSQACYVLDISGYMQGLWNRYRKAKSAAGNGTVDLSAIADRSIYLGPDAYDLFTTSFAKVQGMAGDGNTAPVKIDLTYTLIK